ncbi:exodeoxyribonuclease VII large subunit [Candidatus Vallotia cooleyia]|uniref:exodeoxyribonuclease VII large subunit n=1 Tax=Candidatus Vallotiella adelgis TaxID=1177211 RepID=UPI001D00B317|nr:exodeoxyribonuclease VII large subunit [Candidatus Vallotia cooleyia]UDG82140.1 Exodeoxyribonuclease 7 large subunit [Candidatus Vallotia cooleyia]
MKLELSPSTSLVDGGIVIPVSALNRTISALLGQALPLAWIAGEVSNFIRAASGHWYFSIKDDCAQIRCVMFRGRAQYAQFSPRAGDWIEVRATVAMYEPRGELQLNVETVRRTGQGRLYEAFLKLKGQLESEGLFAAERKRTLPLHPRSIGIITSLQAAALRDVLITLARRAPHVSVIIYPAPVQGAEAAARLSTMIGIANHRAEVNVLIVCRGGGSIEDLWVFNDESLARTIASSALPIVSGIGHETDCTIADFAADVRMPTPTAAAELVSPQHAALLNDLSYRYTALARSIVRMMERRAQQLDWLARRLISPAERIMRQRQHLQQLSLRLCSGVARLVQSTRAQLTILQLRWQRSRLDIERLAECSQYLWYRLRDVLRRKQEHQCARVSALAARVELLSPRRTLERGYAAMIEPHSGAPVRALDVLNPGQCVIVHLAHGSADLGIAHVQPRLDQEF